MLRMWLYTQMVIHQIEKNTSLQTDFFNNKHMNENENDSSKESEGQNTSKGCQMGIDDLVIMNVPTALTKLHQQDGAWWTPDNLAMRFRF